MPIQQLSDVRVFRQIVVSGSIGAAARALGDKKNRVSQRLAALERALGVRLADRTTRSFRLTEEGKRFYAASGALVDAADRAEASIAAGERISGRVRVSIYSSLVGSGIGGQVTQLLQRAPELELQIAVIDDNADLIGQGIDLAVQVSPLRDSSMIAKSLGAVPYAMAAAPAYIRRHGEPSRPGELEEHECIRRFGATPESAWPLLDTRGNKTMAKIGGRLECSDARMQRDILMAGFGIGLVPVAELREAAAVGSLCPVLPEYRLPPLHAWAVCPKGRLRLQRIAPVVDLLQRAVAALR